MSLACNKDYTIHISPLPVSAYWKLDEALGTVPRADSIAGANLLPLGATEPGTAALINLGVKTSASFAGHDYSTSPPSIGLAYTTGKSFSLWGWFRINATGPSGATGASGVEYVLSFVEGILIAVGSSTDPTPLRISSAHDGVYLPVTLAAWNFFHLFYDATVQKYGYSLNSAGETLLPTVVVPASDPNAFCALWRDWTGAVGETVFDEIGLSHDARLSASQVNYLYNAGSGRTYPFT